MRSTLMLATHEPAPGRVINGDSRQPLLIVCEHASPRLPEALQGRYPEHLINSHYGCDLGTERLVERLSSLLNARAVLANYSRIVIDCNRRLDDPTLILSDADGQPVAANQALSDTAVSARIESIYAPFHALVETELAALSAAPLLPVYLAIHSFTPALAGMQRPWDVGLMWDVDDRLAIKMYSALNKEPSLFVGANEPYSGKHVADFSVDYHAERHGLANLAIEIRQDHLASDAGIERWAQRLASALSDVLGNDALHCADTRSLPDAEFVDEAAVFSTAARHWSQENAR
ncbi:MAG: N-formylglutamate amidohydrolase [Pseudomonadota bacterium]